MPARASAEWRGGVRSGAGDSISGGFTYKWRFEDGPGSNPEQLLGAAHAENAKANCPVSRALAGVPEVNLTATLDTATNAS